MRGKIGDKERLGHILDAIIEIESYTANVELKYSQNERYPFY